MESRAYTHAHIPRVAQPEGLQRSTLGYRLGLQPAVSGRELPFQNVGPAGLLQNWPVPLQPNYGWTATPHSPWPIPQNFTNSGFEGCDAAQLSWMPLSRELASPQLLYPAPPGLPSGNLMESMCNSRDHHSIPYNQPLRSQQPPAWNSSTATSCRTMSAPPSAVHELWDAPRQQATDLVEYIPYQCNYCKRVKQSTCEVVSSRPRIRSESPAACLFVSSPLFD